MGQDEEKGKLRIVETVAKKKRKQKQRNDAERDEDPGEKAAMLEEAKNDGGDDTDKGDEEVELSASLTENTYSIVYVANPKSWAFYFGISFFLFQTALPVLALNGLLGK